MPFVDRHRAGQLKGGKKKKERAFLSVAQFSRLRRKVIYFICKATSWFLSLNCECWSVCVYECVCVISTSHCNRPPTTTRSLGLTQSFPEHFLHLDKNSLQLKTLKTQNRAALFVFRPFLCRFELNNIRLDTKICYNPH